MENKTYSFPVAEFNQSLKRAFNGVPNNIYIEMDGRSALNKYLRESWNYFVEEGLIRTVNIDLDQEFFIKGYITDKGKKLIRSL